MSYFTEVFPEKYACLTVSLLKEGIHYSFDVNTLKKSNNTFAWDHFKVPGIAVENIRIRA